MKFKYLAVPSLAITLLLTGCGQKDSDNNKESKDKQEEKQEPKVDDNEYDTSHDKGDTDTNNVPMNDGQGVEDDEDIDVDNHKSEVPENNGEHVDMSEKRKELWGKSSETGSTRNPNARSFNQDTGEEN